MTTPVGSAPVGQVQVVILKVRTPSGHDSEVIGQAEYDFYTIQAAKYQVENQFTNTSDLLDLDRLLFYELLIFRLTNWLGSGKNWYGETLMAAHEIEARRSMKEASTIISSIKNDLGMTKNQRDKAAYESVGTYIVTLQQRARAFGKFREKQLTKSIALTKQLFSLLGAYDRSDEQERTKIGLEGPEDILDWVRDVMMPEFNAIDEHFRTHEQSIWVRDL